MSISSLGACAYLCEDKALFTIRVAMTDHDVSSSVFVLGRIVNSENCFWVLLLTEIILLK